MEFSLTFVPWRYAQGGAQVALHAAESRRQKLLLLKNRASQGAAEGTERAASRGNGDAFGLDDDDQTGDFDDAEL